MATRRERVVLELEDRFTRPMVEAAAAAKLLDKNLDHLSGNAVQSKRTTRELEKEVGNLGKTSNKTEKDIDKLSGRLRILADVAAILGPSLVPIGAVAVPAITGMASALGFAALGAGTLVLAFQGVGDTLKAVNKAALEPTTENLNAAHDALARLSPEARKFVKELQGLKPEFEHLRDLAATGLFPGLSEGLHGLEGALPRVEKIITAISTELGDIAGDAGTSLGSKRWAPFLDFLATEGPSALGDFAKAAGNTAHALAGLWMSTTPLNRDFSKWLVDSTADLDKWANGLGKTRGFQEFVAYIEQTGPQVADTFGAIADAALQIVEATAPLAGPVLKGLEAVAKVVGTLADSDLGTPIFATLAGLALYNRGMATAAALNKATFGGAAVTSIRGQGSAIRQLAKDYTLLNRAQSSQPGFIGPRTQAETAARANLGGAARTLGKSAAAIGAVTLATSGALDKIHLTNTASLGLAGTLGGPLGVGLGVAVGGFLDAKAASDQLNDSLKAADLAAAAGDIDGLAAALERQKQVRKDLSSHDGVGDTVSDYFGNVLGGDLKTKVSASLGASQLGPIGAGFTKIFGEGKTGADKFGDAIEKNKQILADLNYEARANATAEFIGDGFRASASDIDVATQSANTFTAALARVNDALTGRASLRDYEAALDTFSEGLKKNGQTLDINTAKGRENQANLDAIASSALGVAKTLEGTERAEYLKKARAGFYQAARQARMSKDAAHKLAKELLRLNNMSAKPTIDINTKKLMSKLSAAQRKIANLVLAINGLNGTKPSVTYNAGGTDGDPSTPQADGGSVPKTGKPYADRHLYLLADGEEVISNRHGQADRHRALLKDINSNRLAGGGTAGIPDDLQYTPGSGGGSNGTKGGGKGKGSGSGWTAAMRRELKHLQDALAASTKSINKERSARDDLRSKRAELASNVAGGFQRDLFGDKPTNYAYMTEADRQKYLTQNPLDILGQDTANAGKYGDLLKVLAGKGLDGAAFGALAGSNDLERVQAYANQTPAQIAAFEAAFNAREKAAKATGSFAGKTAYNKQIEEANDELRKANKHHKAIEHEIKEIRKEAKHRRSHSSSRAASLRVS